MHAYYIPNPKFMVMAEMSTFAIFCGRNVRGPNIQAKMSVAKMSVAEMSVAEMCKHIHVDQLSNVILLPSV